jgi:hypothetical protein
MVEIAKPGGDENWELRAGTIIKIGGRNVAAVDSLAGGKGRHLQPVRARRVDRMLTRCAGLHARESTIALNRSATAAAATLVTMRFISSPINMCRLMHSILPHRCRMAFRRIADSPTESTCPNRAVTNFMHHIKCMKFH